jgi:aspartate kinase
MQNSRNAHDQPRPMVMKFGGAALATPQLIQRTAQTIAVARSQQSVIVVVSAMGVETDRLDSLVRQVNPRPDASEADTVLAAGEQISAGLVALALQSIKVPARSFVAHQLPLITDGYFGDANIIGVGTSGLIEALSQGVVPVVTGFQGIDEQGRLVTLGRGGSDSTAVAIAAAMSAEVCEFYKDVDGIYSADPKKNPHARFLDRLTISQMRHLAECEPQVLHTKAIRMANELGVHLHVRSAFKLTPGTLILPDHSAPNQNLTQEELYA